MNQWGSVMLGRKLNITVHIECLSELPANQQYAWDKYYQKLFSDSKKDLAGDQYQVVKAV